MKAPGAVAKETHAERIAAQQATLEAEIAVEELRLHRLRMCEEARG